MPQACSVVSWMRDSYMLVSFVAYCVYVQRVCAQSAVCERVLGWFSTMIL